jgi:hypothetical protein
VHVTFFIGVAEHLRVSAEKATTLGEPFWEGHTAPPAGEGVPYDNIVSCLADEYTEAMTTSMEVVVAAQRHGEVCCGDAVRWV